MTEQEIANAIQDIQASLSNRWWQNAGFVLLGAVPSALVAWLNFRWNKNLFDLTKHKEEVRIKAEIAGKIKSVEYKIKKIGDEYIMKWVAAEFFETYKKLLKDKVDPQPLIDKIGYPTEESLVLINQLADYENELYELLARYNYLVKDKQIDVLLEAYKKTGIVGATRIREMSYEELQQANQMDAVNFIRKKYYENYLIALETIVDHIMYFKKVSD